jgi:ABC-type spermidine/putrescine transport system permease subunit II
MRIRKQPFFLAIGAAILVLPMIALISRSLEDEVYYESWEDSRTSREVLWMQEPMLHKLKIAFCFR